MRSKDVIDYDQENSFRPLEGNISYNKSFLILMQEYD